jgi:hypothetical protein
MVSQQPLDRTQERREMVEFYITDSSTVRDMEVVSDFE